MSRTKLMGEWITVRRQWHDVGVRNCSLCGKMLPGVVWRAEIGRRVCEFCDPECEELYWEYWLPRYGELEPAGGT